MMQWKKWVPDAGFYGQMYAKSSFISDKGVVLGFEDEAKTKKITFNFENGFLSLRETEEGCFMKSFESLNAYLEKHIDLQKESWFLFKVENSEYIRRFKAQSLGAYNEEKIEHYVIITYDVISEVLSTSAPKIKVESVG